MKLPKLIAGCVAICCLSVANGVTADEKDTITWANLHFPPWMILEGANQGKGVWDQLLDKIISELPEYHHEKEIMTNLRYTRNWRSRTRRDAKSIISKQQNGKKFCTIPLPRWYFSRTTSS